VQTRIFISSFRPTDFQAYALDGFSRWDFKTTFKSTKLDIDEMTSISERNPLLEF
jgi:hypothetical protein